MRPEDVASQFNDAINQRDLAALSDLMTDDYTFTDSTGASVVGKAASVDAWRGFFEAFPDYRNTFAELWSTGDTAFAVGYSTCSVPELDGPAIWTAEVRGDRVAHWRVFGVTPDVRGQLGI